MRVALLSVWLVVCPLVAPPTGAGQAADTTRASVPEALFNTRDLYFAGGFVLGTAALWPLDVRVAEEIQDSVLQNNRAMRGLASGFRFLGYPGSVLVGGGLYALGRVTDRPRLADLGLHTAEAIVLAEAITFPLKGLAGRARPRVDVREPYDFELGRGIEDDLYQSFPSGHSTAAFATAAAVTSELAEWWPERKPLIGTLLFGGATLVGVSRLYHNNHWASDVMAGAAIGSFSGWKVVRYHHSRPGNWLDRTLLSTTAVPDGRGGMLIVWSAGGSR